MTTTSFSERASVLLNYAWQAEIQGVQLVCARKMLLLKEEARCRKECRDII